MNTNEYNVNRLLDEINYRGNRPQRANVVDDDKVSVNVTVNPVINIDLSNRDTTTTKASLEPVQTSEVNHNTGGDLSSTLDFVSGLAQTLIGLL